jgi:hypothetical protein
MVREYRKEFGAAGDQEFCEEAIFQARLCAGCHRGLGSLLMLESHTSTEFIVAI